MQHLAWFLSRGFGPHGWGQPSWDWGYRWQRPDLYQHSVRELEQAGFDFLLIEDALSLGSPETLDLRVREAYGGPKHDPWVLAPYLFAATRHLGVIPTANPLSYAPYVAARQLASLHHLSAGRLGVNVVTDVGSSRHLGTAPLPHDAAYDRAQEWLTGVQALWRSWGDGALVEDAATGRYADGGRLDAVRHRGEHYTFDGPLNAAPFEGAEPVVASPGGSPRGIAFAGAHSQVQLALAHLDVDTVRAYLQRIRDAARDHGRDPADITTFFVLKPVVTASAEEADRVVRASAEPSDADLLTAARAWSSDLETDLTGLDLDRPLDVGVFGDHVSRGTIKGLQGDLPDLGAVPFREVLTRKARLRRVTEPGGTVGTAEEVADLVQALGDDAGNEGILLSGDLHPVTLHRVLDELVPVLRRRGVLRREYGDGGLLGHLRDF